MAGYEVADQENTKVLMQDIKMRLRSLERVSGDKRDEAFWRQWKETLLKVPPHLRGSSFDALLAMMPGLDGNAGSVRRA
jgi:hypothetical protein